MATDTFQALVDTDYSSFLNYDTLSVPTSTDDMVCGAIGTTGSVSCANLSGSSEIQGGTITVNGTASGIVVNGGSVIGATGTLVATSCTFDTDPGGTQINSSAGCFFSPSGGMFGPKISDDGSATYGAGVTFNGTVASTTMFTDSACTFAGAVTCNQIHMGSATFSRINQTGESISLEVGSVGQIVWTNVTTFTVAGLVQTNSDGSASVNVNGALATAHPVAKDNILAPDGNWQRPGNVSTDADAAPLVKDGEFFGANGATEGTFAGSGGGSASGAVGTMGIAI